ncbi:MAG: tetratricopeptide (TPR) repeat protein [Saprospiraceae bacterium]|jgi:tetratricopeptide (TPR) repeat protein
MMISCVTTRKSKSEVGWIGKKWHDMNARYNGYFNAKELYRASSSEIQDSHVDNYNQILSVYQWGEPEERESAQANMDISIEKVTKVAALHEPSKWVDDCYVLMGKSQFLKGDLESAQETFEYFVDDFNPTDPDSRVYASPDRESKAKTRKKEAQDERKIQEDQRKKEKKEKDKTRKQKEKDRKKASKQREKDRKQRIKDRKSGKKSTRKPTKIPQDPTLPETPPPSVVASSNQDIPIDEDEAYLRDLEAQKTQKKEDVDYGGGFMKHRPAFFEGMLWLAQTYIARDRWIEANYFLTKLEKELGVPDDILSQLPALRADYFLEQKDYANALPALEQAIEVSKDRRLKARLSFILAQVYQMKGEVSKAFAAFEAVDKYKPDFEMSLQAEVSKLRNSWSAGNESSDKAVKKLDRLAKEDKYEQFRGSIYSAAAEILLASGDQTGAMEYFQKALSGNNNKAVQNEIYYRLGSLFFNNKDYVSAKNYYDSTLQVMPEKDERYTQVSNYADNLKGIANNIKIISVNDSLLELGSRSKSGLRSFARNKATESWKTARELEKAAATEGGFTATTSVVSANSKFFAYNPTIKTKGKQAFLKRWGNRPLQDNWRLASKIENSQTEDVEEVEVEETMPDAELEREINKILRGIPQSDEQKKKVNAEIENALFELGTGFRTNLEKYQESNESLEELFVRFPNTSHAPESYFFMYLNHIDLGQTAQAEVAKNKLLNEFPQSDFAIYLKNPAGSQVLMTEARRIELAYEKAYQQFESGDYQKTFDLLEEGNKKFGEKHEMAAKYGLLKAMCLGSLKGRDEYINALRSVILRYNNTPEQAHARELIRFLRGDKDSFVGDGEVDEEAMKNFVTEEDKLHYIIVVLFDDPKSEDIDKAKASINAFNEKNYKGKRLRATSIVLNRELKSHLVLIRRFSNKDDSMTYYKNVNQQIKNFLDEKKFSFEVLSINQKNYRQVMKDKSVNNYRSFFDSKYLTEE